ncbi:50S ribosomal protein L15 [Amygdalobacter nucleatus]|uniref:Large ribosomal subunit protein uL15 n=1 Tax=Amygdalobacter nucleatus TaxID=3029274 RepID=A0A133Y6X1_9FIRM|nr:50S ribosomal protein L15 [Amygdalobacter nucleatus]KXB38958.1 ribosomal protein L15 [Amygdalobacter nucleatus]MDF0485310.1 50S ribosomal protein L15 [Amygdalobacter nucleatus]WEG36823.1 50S ribosomal protein L15 [Amygdalobacter nucleatus]
MKLNDLKPSVGSNKKAYRKGRGIATGNGKTAGRGQKGQMARSGGGTRWGFEGGQTPMFRRMSKRGFNNYNFVPQSVEITVGRLNAFEEGAEVTLESVRELGLVKFSKAVTNLVILGGGELTKKLTVKANRFTAAAKEAIQQAGGTATEV